MLVSFYSIPEVYELNEKTINSIKLKLSKKLDPQETRFIDLLSKWYKSEEIKFQSSGSTGLPKEFLFESKNLAWSAKASIQAMELSAKDHFLLAMDVRFVGAAMLVIRAAILDARISLIPLQSNISQFIPNQHSFTQVSLVPFQIQSSLENDHDAPSKFKQFSKILLGGGPLDEELLGLIKKHQLHCLHSYGMTETLSHIALRNPLTTERFKPFEQIKLRLNEDGCLCINTPFLASEICTNDIGKIFEDGSFQIIGRADDIINTGGLKINPIELESYIASQINLIGINWIIGWVPDNKLGQKLVLISEGTKMEDSDFEKIQAICKTYSKPQAIPRENLSIEKFERTENFKIMRALTIQRLHYLMIK